MRLARMSNRKYQTYLAELLKPIRHKIQRGLADPDEIREKENQAIARYVLLDWQNLQDTDENGQEVDVPYSEQKAFEYLQEVNDFRELVLAFSRDPEFFRTEKDEQEEKETLGKRSNGTPSGDRTSTTSASKTDSPKASRSSS